LITDFYPYLQVIFSMSNTANQQKVNAFSKALAAALQIITGKPAQTSGRVATQPPKRRQRSAPKAGHKR
jgi:hypothetical protein